MVSVAERFSQDCFRVENPARWYNPEVGKWISEDGIGFAGDPSNLTRYVTNSATLLVDSNGLKADLPTWFNRKNGINKEYTASLVQKLSAPPLAGSDTFGSTSGRLGGAEVEIRVLRGDELCTIVPWTLSIPLQVEILSINPHDGKKLGQETLDHIINHERIHLEAYFSKKTPIIDLIDNINKKLWRLSGNKKHAAAGKAAEVLNKKLGELLVESLYREDFRQNFHLDHLNEARINILDLTGLGGGKVPWIDPKDTYMDSLKKNQKDFDASVRLLFPDQFILELGKPPLIVDLKNSIDAANKGANAEYKSKLKTLEDEVYASWTKL
ncbi:MAG: RHS repeat-associated core domain-containing protein [Planctomycetota bacterium]|nr:RHS repeat-associated core domain-containing protein [Planctomycetota bacterium]